MSRQRYETTDHMLDERETMPLVERAFGWKLMKPPSSYEIDWCALTKTGDIAAWLEYKGRRSYRSDQYETYFLSARKFRAGYTLALSTSLPFIVVMGWSDVTVYHVCSREARALYTFRWGGRTVQTRDVADVEPMIHIPASLFTPIQKQ